MWKAFNNSVEIIFKDITNRHFKFICNEGQHLYDLINDVKIN